MRALSPKQERFIREYPLDLCGAEAARRSGYSVRSARQIAKQLLRDKRIRDRIDAAIAKRIAKLEVTPSRVLEEIARLAFVDASRVCRVEKGRVVVVDTDKLTEDERRAIAEIAETDSGLRVKLHDKLRALEMLGRHLGMFLDRTEHSGKLALENGLSDQDLERIAAGGSAGAASPPASAPKPS